MKKEELKNLMALLKTGYKNKNCTVSLYFEYRNKSKGEIGFATSTIDSVTEDSMLTRIIKSFSETKIENCSFEEFDILKEHKSSITYAALTKFENAKVIIEKLQNGETAEDLSVLGKKLGNAKGVVLKIVSTNISDPIFAFIPIEKFNAFKKRGWNTGMIATINNDGIQRIDDTNKMFGIREEVGFLFYKGDFIIHSPIIFERMLQLSNEYKEKAEQNVNQLDEKFSKILINIKDLKSDLKGKGSMPLNRTLAKISLKALEDKFSKDNLYESLKELKNIAEKEEFKDKLKGVVIDEKNGTITYSSTSKFGFVALLSDRPAETLFLGRRFID